MNRTIHHARSRSRGIKAALAALLFVVTLATTLLVVDQTDAATHMGELEPLITSSSQALQASGYCASQVGRPTCKEVCIICIDGHIVPQGTFMCTP